MKNAIWFIAIVFTIQLSSCDKEEFKKLEYWGRVSADKNAANWASLPSGGISNINGKFFVSCNVYNSSDIHREQLLLFKIPLLEGSYNVEKTRERDEDEKVGAMFFTVTDDGDVIGDIYDISELDSTSTISILKIDL